MKTLLFSLLLLFTVNVGSLMAQTIPNFTLENVTLSNYKSNKAIVIVFTSSHCTFAKEYVGRLNQLANQFSSQGVQFVAINSNDPTLAVDDKPEKMRLVSNYSFPYLKDADQQVAKLFGATRTPEVFVLKSSGGQFEVNYHGAIDDNPIEAAAQKRLLESAIQATLAGKPAGNSNISVGSCGIKWK